MGDIIVRTESTAELWQAAQIGTGPVSNCATPYDPLYIAEPLQIATFEIKIQYKATYNGDISWQWKVVGDPKITKDENLTPTIKSWYDSHLPANSPVMEDGLNSKLQSKLKEELTTSKEKAIKAQIKEYYQYSNILHLRQSPGMNELTKIFAAKAKMQSTPYTYTPITLTGRVMIIPRMITAAKETDTAEMTYTSGSGSETAKGCATAQMVVSSTIANFPIQLDNVIESSGDVDLTSYDPIINDFGIETLDALNLDEPNIYAQMETLRNNQLTLMQQYAETFGNYQRYQRWLREWSNNQRTTIRPQGDGWFKFGLGSTGPGVFNIGVIIPFGEGGLYFNSTTIYMELSVNRLAQEIGFWQQYAARVRENTNNTRTRWEQYQNNLLQKPPVTSTTNLTLDPKVPIDTALPANPEIGQAPSNAGTGPRDGALGTTPDLSPFFPGPTPPFFPFDPGNGNGGFNGFQLF